MRIYRALSRLLDYPDQELMENLGAIRELVGTEAGLTKRDREDLLKFLDWMGGRSLLELEQNYVQTFDNRPENSLHLTHHLFGDDDRGRGPALINLNEHYKSAGISPSKGELPDFLPLVLEYAGTLPEDKVGPFLGDAAKVMPILAGSLERDESPYAPLIRLLERHGEPFLSAA